MARCTSTENPSSEALSLMDFEEKRTALHRFDSSLGEAGGRSCGSTSTRTAKDPSSKTTTTLITPSSLTRSNADYYFTSYSRPGIHKDMLEDEVRTQGYRRAILKNRHLFKDKIVLDIGSGTGILSLLAVQAGAKKVYACEYSNIMDVAKEVAELNSRTESSDETAKSYKDRIQFFNCRAEDLPIEKNSVDILLSEWMGYLLLYEGMADTILYCRDHYLKKRIVASEPKGDAPSAVSQQEDAASPTTTTRVTFPDGAPQQNEERTTIGGSEANRTKEEQVLEQEAGLIFPDRCAIYLAGVDDFARREEKLLRWTEKRTSWSRYDFSAIGELVLKDGIVCDVTRSSLSTTPVRVIDIDLNTISAEELDFETEFELFPLVNKMKKSGRGASTLNNKGNASSSSTVEVDELHSEEQTSSLPLDQQQQRQQHQFAKVSSFCAWFSVTFSCGISQSVFGAGECVEAAFLHGASTDHGLQVNGEDVALGPQGDGHLNGVEGVDESPTCSLSATSNKDTYIFKGEKTPSGCQNNTRTRGIIKRSSGDSSEDVLSDESSDLLSDLEGGREKSTMLKRRRIEDPSSLTRSRLTSESNKSVHVEVLNTSPATPLTHWKMCVFLLRNELTLRGAGSSLRGKFSLCKAKGNVRDLDMRISCRVLSEEESKQGISDHDLEKGIKDANAHHQIVDQTFHLR
ncbi:unnamed protein product [Amoebophrya sp. A25]|nr:unnamed protein product [Amoebophrya sp. A25]|eukprot:GSA25T00020351001.1